MKLSLASGSGYLQIDHRESPGLTPADVAHVPGAVAVPGGQQFEVDAQVCSHCQRGVLLNPDRVRPRAVCLKCYHYICDECEAIRVASGGACVPFAQVLDRAAEHISAYAGQPDHPNAASSLEALQAPSAPRIVLTDM